VAPALRRALTQVAPDLPTTTFRPLRQIVDRAMSPRRFFVELLVAFAGAALALAAIGIYGVLSYSVARRTSEIGGRMALGASSGRIRSSVVSDTLRLALTGATIGGIAASIAVSSVLTSLLYGASPGDPWTYAAAAAMLLIVAVAAGTIPAIRASRISPITALRARHEPQAGLRDLSGQQAEQRVDNDGAKQTKAKDLRNHVGAKQFQHALRCSNGDASQ
jgi:predicted lysophospholipase L1 biosynthesis ABC-type transport system permease subunit